MKIARRVLLCSCLCCLPLSFALGQTSRNSSLTDNPVYKKDCAKCHGKTAEGRHFGGPSLLAEKTTSMPADDLRNLITNGKHRMPKFSGKLTAAEIDTLVSQIKSAGK
ncbi:MAG TPA: cytochrome c [Candidatus Acidoferrales bacterium]|nr:cytochrome c [Candidatus Acidoferrales bacterium]